MAAGPSKIWRLSIVLVCLAGLSSCRMGGQRRPAATAPPVPPGGLPTELPGTETRPALEPSATTPAIVPLEFAQGRNDYILDVDGTPREFIVYVPAGYDPNLPTPVVYVIHGSNMSGQKMYENTHWARKADEENILIVYPTSWEYPLIDEPGLHEKWNTPGTATQVQPGTELKDDVKFVGAILDQLRATFNVDEKRLFASGFSNGGGFVITRLMLQMNDIFAAFASSGSGLFGEAEAGDVPVAVPASLYSIVGTEDNKLAEGQEVSTPFPLAPDEILSDPLFSQMLKKTTTLLGLEASPSIESDPNFTRLTYDQSLSGAGNEYIFLMIRRLHHVYPDGEDSPSGIDGADEFWDFFLEHSKP